MELLEFKDKIFDLLNIKNTGEIGEKLMKAVLNCDIEFFEKFSEIVDDSKDWLQALWQYYEADRAGKKQDYTPKSLCELVSRLAGNCDSLYDCCGGTGALTLQNLKEKNIKNIFIDELDENVIPFLLFNLCLQNASGYVINGNVLTNKKFKVYELKKGNKYSQCEIIESAPNPIADVCMSNPPFNIKWDSPSPLEAIEDGRFPVIPPDANANFAFVFHCLSIAKEKVIVILPNGALSSNYDLHCKSFLVEKDLIEAVITLPDGMFESTNIPTCIIVFSKNKKHKGKICFIDSRKNCIVEEREQRGQYGGKSHTNRVYKKEQKVLSKENIDKILDALEKGENIKNFCSINENSEILAKDIMLTPTRYIEFEEGLEQHRNFQEIAENINYIMIMKNSCKLTINETVAKELGLDCERYKRAKETSCEMQKNMEKLGIHLEKDDYISFTKNKNEFVFKCNNGDFIPSIMADFLKAWASQTKLLTQMENKYLAELRDALLPDLMSGKIDLEGIT